jgi:hypothetical protein
MRALFHAIASADEGDFQSPLLPLGKNDIHPRGMPTGDSVINCKNCYFASYEAVLILKGASVN